MVWLGFRVYGLVWGLGFRGLGGSRVWGSRGLGFMV